jgi:hypothetical protein
MRLTRVQWVVFQAALVLLFNLIVYQKSEALFISIQNIGGSPITAAQFIFEVEPCQGVPFTFQIVSSRNRIDPTNIFLQFDEAHPIGIGETYNTPIIPELTGTNFRLTGDQINGFGIAMVEGLGPGIFIIPDVTTHELFNSNINFGAIISFHSGGTSTSINVSIDIKPGEFPNSINPNSQGVIPVAILATNTFDITTINPSTVRFDATGTEAAPVQVALEDVNSDGRLDLLFHFNTQDTGIQCNETSASLTGKTVSRQVIEGSDAITTVGCR